jgi:hypothetical protein
MAYVQKALITRVLPLPVTRLLRRSWENIRDWVDTLRFGLSFAWSRSLRPKVLLYFGFAPGDDLLCTAVLRELRKRDHDPLLMVSDHQVLFEGNPDAAYVRPLWARYWRDHSTVSISKRFVQIWGGQFTRLEYAPLTGLDRRKPPSRHVIAEMCACAGVSGTVSIRPYLTLRDEEKAAAAWAKGGIVIQSSGLDARHPMLNKQWAVERFQAVVDALAGEFQFIQIGSTADPPLKGAKNLAGVTTIRESAAILCNARLYVGTVGFLMHLARAVECPSVIIFGGREAPWQTGYVCNLNMYSDVPCAPCWRSNTCDFDRQCMSVISADDVVLAIRQMLARPRNPLVVETVEITPDAPDAFLMSGKSSSQ